jgi:hypothetical protein
VRLGIIPYVVKVPEEGAGPSGRAV